jgi:isoprenylcysteine carboxyl methyltransferase (ICMT) family protein YpbQ
MVMIPLENRTYLIKRLKQGWDIRTAAADAKITRSTLYKYFKEFPAFRADVDKVIATFIARKQKKDTLTERYNLMHLKEIARNRRL